MHPAAHTLRWLLCVLLLAPAPLATAQDAQEAARAAFTDAERAFEEHDYEMALERFRRAQSLHPHDAVRFNVAVCLERLGRFREALGEYELAAASLQLSEEAREEARRLDAVVRARLGTLTVRAEAGATVRAGSSSCVAPCSLELDPGAHRVEIELDGRSVTREVQVTRGGAHALEIDALEVGALEVGALEPSREPPEGAAEVSSPTGWSSFGAMSAIGAVAAVIGAGGTIGFGMHTEALASSYAANASLALRDEGLTMRALTNASIGLAAAGLVLIAVDLVLWLVDPPRGDLSLGRDARIAF